MATYIVFENPNKLKIGLTKVKTDIRGYLFKRYQTTFGKNVNINIYPCLYPELVEYKIHKKLLDYNISNELFKVKFGKAERILKKIITNEHPIDTKYLINFLTYKTLQKIAIFLQIPANKSREIIIAALLKEEEFISDLPAAIIRRIGREVLCEKTTKVGIIDFLMNFRESAAKYELNVSVEKKKKLKKKLRVHDLDLLANHYGEKIYTCFLNK